MEFYKGEANDNCDNIKWEWAQKKSLLAKRLAVIILKLINSRSDGSKSLLHLKCENWAQNSLMIVVPYLLPPFDNVFLLLDS